MPAPFLPISLRLLPIAALLAAGCASSPPGVDAQWRAPDAGPALGGGARVLVACEAAETALVRLCVERLAAELTARGARAVPAPDAPPPPAGGRLQWTARAASGATGDAGAQLDALARRLVDAAAGAGLF
ncbi:hypothetical protein CKO37_10845 [Rubrivivax gelatinosus]|nr:hypothetical protein [Rubrivivax gelatinosus]